MKIKPVSKHHVNDRFIVSAANKLGDTGVILVGTRHWDSLMNAQWKALKQHEPFKSVSHENIEQGFVDRQRNFLTREEAYNLAIETGQEMIGEDWGELFSENLY